MSGYNLAGNTCLWWASSEGNKARKHAVVTLWVLWCHSDVHETCLYWLWNRLNKVVWLGSISMVCNGQRFFHRNSNLTEISTPLTLILIQWSLQNFVHDTTAVLSWHVQIFVAIWWPDTELQQSKISIEFELRATIVWHTVRHYIDLMPAIFEYHKLWESILRHAIVVLQLFHVRC